MWWRIIKGTCSFRKTEKRLVSWCPRNKRSPETPQETPLQGQCLDDLLLVLSLPRGSFRGLWQRWGGTFVRLWHGAQSQRRTESDVEVLEPAGLVGKRKGYFEYQPFLLKGLVFLKLTKELRSSEGFLFVCNVDLWKLGRWVSLFI